MMNMSQLAELISFVGGLTALLVTIGILHAQCVDETRSDLFDLRDEMFLYASDNNISETDAYRSLRELMNGFIRYAHRLTLTRVFLIVIVSSIVAPNFPKSFRSAWEPSLDMLNSAYREQMRGFYKRNMILVTTHLVHRSLILRAFVRGVIAYRKLKGVSGNAGASQEAVMSEVSHHVPWRSMEAEAQAA
jgi:hypothetical protein